MSIADRPGGGHVSVRRSFSWLVANLFCTCHGLAPVTAFAHQEAPTELLCSMRTGESTATLRVAAGMDHLAISSTRVGDSYEVRAVALARLASKEQVADVVVTVLDLEGNARPAVLSQSRLSSAGRDVLDGRTGWRPSLSGWQRVYSPKLGRELAWGCALVLKGARPDGWDHADATSLASPACYLAAETLPPSDRFRWMRPAATSARNISNPPSLPA